MCQHRIDPRHMEAASDCCCGCGSGFRRFRTVQEKRERLENYRDQLMKELAGVEEHIKESESK